jgi:hypothetical protein
VQNAAIRRLVHTADTWSRNETSYMNGTKNLLILVFTKVQDYYYEGTEPSNNQVFLYSFVRFVRRYR